jgi:hypothetical protein
MTPPDNENSQKGGLADISVRGVHTERAGKLRTWGHHMGTPIKNDMAASKMRNQKIPTRIVIERKLGLWLNLGKRFSKISTRFSYLNIPTPTVNQTRSNPPIANPRTMMTSRAVRMKSPTGQTYLFR